VAALDPNADLVRHADLEWSSVGVAGCRHAAYLTALKVCMQTC
jgi:hypothetical protein